mmetsp:Transcript_3368/g.8399  ORF Transcript_3368/g.8399 Transcript_3368/m.8399 type:complete len:254 (-) Transcript_3368:42-803(-)
MSAAASAACPLTATPRSPHSAAVLRERASERGGPAQSRSPNAPEPLALTRLHARPPQLQPPPPRERSASAALASARGGLAASTDAGLELREALVAASLRDDLDYVEAHGLRERAALADEHLVAGVEAEARRAVRRERLVALFVPVVLADEVQVVAADDDGAVHLGRLHDAREQAAADRDVAREGALLVDVGAIDGLLGRLNAETHALDVPRLLLAHLLLQHALGAAEYGVLLLESVLGLVRRPHGRHLACCRG